MAGSRNVLWCFCCSTQHLNLSDLAVKTDEKMDRAYPRDFMKVGRVVVHLKREDETLLNPAITSSKITSHLRLTSYTQIPMY
ncbi:hypothetical protein HID58_025234 [Brassica napus]|uniref:Uncharacterized protein n=1 Tax=Brassica napus TaxID=3708 RepID=A0ABQ8CKH7_BRANA|nr:hypothetical protein HID58_025234 [Brassica napus]